MTIYESIKALEIKTFMLFDLDFDSDIIVSYLFLFFLFINLCFLIPAVITQVINPVAELVIPIGPPTKKANTKMETNPVIAEIKISECSL